MRKIPGYRRRVQDKAWERMNNREPKGDKAKEAKHNKRDDIQIV